LLMVYPVFAKSENFAGFTTGTLVSQGLDIDSWSPGNTTKWGVSPKIDNDANIVNIGGAYGNVLSLVNSTTGYNPMPAVASPSLDQGAKPGGNTAFTYSFWFRSTADTAPGGDNFSISSSIRSNNIPNGNGWDGVARATWLGFQANGTSTYGVSAYAYNGNFTSGTFVPSDTSFQATYGTWYQAVVQYIINPAGLNDDTALYQIKDANGNLLWSWDNLGWEGYYYDANGNPSWPSADNPIGLPELTGIGFNISSQPNTGGIYVDDITYTATPIPGALWLFGSGLVGLGVFRRRLGSLIKS